MESPNPSAPQFVYESLRHLLGRTSGEAYAVIGTSLLPVSAVAIQRGRPVVRVADWCWPDEEPDLAGELVLRDRSRAIEARLTGRWSPVGVVELVTATERLVLLDSDLRFADPWSRLGTAPVVRLVVANALVSDGPERFALEGDDPLLADVML